MKASQSHLEFESVGSCYSDRLKNDRMEEKPNTFFLWEDPKADVPGMKIYLGSGLVRC